MKALSWIVGGLIGGAIGAAIWAAVSMGTGMEIGWIAWLVGVLVGLGVRLAAREDDGWGPGIVAALIAIAAVAGGKYATVHMLVNKAVASIQLPPVDDATATSTLADSVVEEWQKQGKTVKWQQGKSLEMATEQEDYPPDVWQEATKRWKALSPSEQRARKAELTQLRSAGLQNMRQAVVGGAFSASFGAFDILWFLLAVITAFRLGSGLSSGE